MTENEQNRKMNETTQKQRAATDRRQSYLIKQTTKNTVKRPMENPLRCLLVSAFTYCTDSFHLQTQQGKPKNAEVLTGVEVQGERRATRDTYPTKLSMPKSLMDAHVFANENPSLLLVLSLEAWLRCCGCVGLPAWSSSSCICVKLVSSPEPLTEEDDMLVSRGRVATGKYSCELNKISYLLREAHTDSTLTTCGRDEREQKNRLWEGEQESIRSKTKLK